ncbi:CGNR zinc finger domain-containing protein [Streptosporangium fragile]|uniref:CGNR zinc finger domain-containing protein n=1 Tax=Streptosporangium fragile TaxID=46186 RepID=A0ABN3W0G7_9ACTN
MNLANGMELTPPDGQRFRFDPGALCLEFLLTGGEGELARWERLHRPDDLAAWIAHSRAGITGPCPVTADELASARRLRAAVQRLAARAATGSRDLPEPDLAVLNEIAAAPPPVPVIGPGLERSWASPVTGAQFLSAVARDAIELFGGPDLDRVRMCAGERCYLLFLDTSRPGTRRWCSMDRCGNRRKLRTRRDRNPPG